MEDGGWRRITPCAGYSSSSSILHSPSTILVLGRSTHHDAPHRAGHPPDRLGRAGRRVRRDVRDGAVGTGRAVGPVADRQGVVAARARPRAGGAADDAARAAAAAAAVVVVVVDAVVVDAGPVPDQGE